MRCVLAVLTVLSGLLVAVSPARASTLTWTADPPASPRVPNGQLDATSCLTARNCTAVGHYTDRGGDERSLTETFDGSAWTVATPPAGSLAGTEATLTGVSCVSASFCAAVGSSAPGAGQQLLAEHWDGSEWTIDPLSIPGQLNAVSCVSTTFCVAVGENDAKAGVILAWDGSSWSRQIPADLGAQYEVSFNGVSCYSIDACTAVGSAQPSMFDFPHALAQRWDGAVWSNTDAVAGSEGSRLNAVSCVAPQTCYAVGISSVNAPRPLAEKSTSAGWQLQTVPDHLNQVQRLTGVSCSSATTCVAVGASEGYQTSAGLSELWDGTQWTARNTPYNPTNTLVAAISCLTAKACIAVGRTQAAPADFTSMGLPRGTLVDRWNGTTWVASTAVDVAGDAKSIAADISCPTTNMCMVVGWYRTRTGTDAPIASMRTGGPGSSWQPLSLTDNDPDLRILLRVSCASPTMCIALGDLIGTNQPVAEIWNGTSWRRTPDLPITSGFVEAIDCVTSTFCLAMGEGQSGNGVIGLIWTGSAWTRTTPVAVANAAFESVSCVSPTFCAIGGRIYPATPERPVAEVWDGSTWKVTPSAARGISYFSAMSCVSTRHCVAVGSYAARGQTLALAETFNGARWQVTDVPEGVGGQGYLSDIDCTSATRCVAVGTRFADLQAGVYGSLIDELDGTTWTATSNVGLTAPAEVGELSAVSCLSNCEVAGYYEHDRDRADPSDFVSHMITLSSGA